MAGTSPATTTESLGLPMKAQLDMSPIQRDMLYLMFISSAEQALSG